MTDGTTAGKIAVVGLDCRVAGARDHVQFWRNLVEGTDTISDVPDEVLRAAGVPETSLADPHYVKRAAVLEDADLFDASFFYLSTREAERMDPQLRVFLQSAWAALEHSGHDSERFEGKIGVFTGALANTYLLNNVLTGETGFGGSVERMRRDLAVLMGNDSNYLATRTSYHLNLTGPGISVQTACSTSLVAIHLAAQSLLGQECDVALAGGVSLRFPQEAGYRYEPSGIASPTGTVRPFDAAADGTVFGNGVGTVVLKRLDDALADGDTIWAVVSGSAVGNDGADRAGYTAPGVTGQASVIAEALAVADVDPATVGYVEAHGTGTRLGDPIEFAALAQSYQVDGAPDCGLGSVKANVGHLSIAAGVVGFIKCVLMLRHGRIVPTPHFTGWNPECGAEGTRFRVPVEVSPWTSADGPLRCAVSSAGMGGTTAHVLLEQAPVAAETAPGRPLTLLPVSAKSPAALKTARAALADALDVEGTSLADAAYTLAIGRRTFNYRAVVIARDAETAVSALRSGDPRHLHHDSGQPQDKPVVFLFPGQGAQHPGMGQEWYRHEPVFTRTVDECAELLLPLLGVDLRDALYPVLRGYDGPALELTRTRLAQPAMFTVGYALAKQWMAWGVRPAAMLGHSIGEYVAACLAGVFSLPDALRLVAERGRLVDALPAGSMAAVLLGPAELAPYLGDEVSLAAVNEPAACTISGPAAALAEVSAKLRADGTASRKVTTSHAFHSAMMDPAVAPFVELVREIPLNRPRIPYLSNLTGTWILDEEATDPEYWGRHLRGTVRFADGLATLLASDEHVFIEVGPGLTLTTFARRHPDRETGVTVLSSASRTREPETDHQALVTAVGRLWAAGATVDWNGFYDGRRRGRLPLPTYPFEGVRHWVEPGSGALTTGGGGRPQVGKLGLDEWFSVPVWKPAYGTVDTTEPLTVDEPVLLFSDVTGVADRLADKAFTGDVIRVRHGDEYARVDDTTWRIRPGSAEDHAALVGELAAEDRLPGRVVQCWAAAGLTAPAGIDRFEQAQQRGLYSLIGLVQAFSGHGVTKPLRIDIVSAGTFAVTETEPEPIAEFVPLSVAAKVIGQEHGNIASRHFDLPSPVDDASLRTLATELVLDRRGEVATALRGRTRWVADLDRLRVDWTRPGTSRLRQDGVYLVTGGLGEIGTIIAHMLHAECGARLALLTRDALPERGDWDDWLAGHPADDEVSLRIGRVRGLEAAGAEPLLLTADVADEPAMRRAVEEVEARFGALNGVVHAAGLPGEMWDRTVTAASVEQCGWHFVPKAHGQIVLERVLAERQVDFCLLLSSLAGVLGGLRLLAYGAANHFMDAAAQRANRGLDRTVWISAGWDVWQHHQDEKRALSAIGRGMDDKAIQPAEGLEAIRRLLTLSDVSQVAVSTWDITHRLDQWVRRERVTAKAVEGLAEGAEAPRGEVADQVVRLVREALGSPEMPVSADIFEFGGDSLLIVRLLSDLRALLDVEVQLADVLGDPTPMALAGLVELALAAKDSETAELAGELASLGDEELERLLSGVETADTSTAGKEL